MNLVSISCEEVSTEKENHSVFILVLVDSCPTWGWSLGEENMRQLENQLVCV